MAERASGKRRDGTFDKPDKGWFYVEEWGLSLARPNSPDSVAEPQTSPTHRVEEEASRPGGVRSVSHSSSASRHEAAARATARAAGGESGWR